jgi:isochorismate pyruvate lyase
MEKTCQSLDEVRFQIDRLDAAIVTLLAERSGYVAQAAAFKRTVGDVVVPERIEAVIENVRAHAESHDADPDLLEAIYRPMIAAFIAFERKQWQKIHGRS